MLVEHSVAGIGNVVAMGVALEESERVGVTGCARIRGPPLIGFWEAPAGREIGPSCPRWGWAGLDFSVDTV